MLNGAALESRKPWCGCGSSSLRGVTSHTAVRVDATYRGSLIPLAWCGCGSSSLRGVISHTAVRVEATYRGSLIPLAWCGCGSSSLRGVTSHTAVRVDATYHGRLIPLVWCGCGSNNPMSYRALILNPITTIWKHLKVLTPMRTLICENMYI